MTTNLIINGNKIEVLDKMVMFEEGEKVFVETEGKNTSYTVQNIIKVIQKSGEKADVTLDVYLA